MKYSPVNLEQKFGLFSEQWQPKVIAEMNDYQFKIVKIEGDFLLREGRLASETSHAGMTRIGFEGIFSAPTSGAPLFQLLN